MLLLLLLLFSFCFQCWFTFNGYLCLELLPVLPPFTFFLTLILRSFLSLSLSDYFSSNSHFSRDLQQVIDTLQSDQDRDVRFFAGAPFYDAMTPRVSEQNINDDVFFTQRLSDSDCNEKIDITGK